MKTVLHMLMRGSNTVGIGNLTEKIKGLATVNILVRFYDNEALWPWQEFIPSGVNSNHGPYSHFTLA
jgi:hypothetical protein